MSSLSLTIYVLIWPVIAAIVMVVLCVALFRDMRKARRDGVDMV